MDAALTDSAMLPAAPAAFHAASGCALPPMTHLDLFSGIGGFALAARMAGGFKTVGFCEIDPWARAALAKNFPGVPIHDDVRTLNPQLYGTIDLITGGCPCQPFSYAGQRLGAADERHLWPIMRGLIATLRPTWVLAENVAGHITLGLDEVLTDLDALGYSTGALVVPACAVGANHRRDRVWIIADSAGNRQQGELCEAQPQEVHHRTSETLGSRHWSSGPFADWEQLMGESKLRRMDDGVSSTVDIRPRLHAYGNAIVPQVAAEILRAIRMTHSAAARHNDRHQATASETHG